MDYIIKAKPCLKNGPQDNLCSDIKNHLSYWSMESSQIRMLENHQNSFGSLETLWYAVNARLTIYPAAVAMHDSLQALYLLVWLRAVPYIKLLFSVFQI